MVNILLEGYGIDAPWLYEELKKYLKKEHKVAVVAFSFRDDRIKNAEDWAMLYGQEEGKYYQGIVGGFAAYGIKEENVQFLNYFTDTKESARVKVEQADIVYYLGGLPDRMLDRIKEFELLEVLAQHDKIVMGYSAGAVIQLQEYHLSPDADYAEFGYYEGIPYLDGFYLEVHYEDSEVQNASIARVLKERKKPAYATHHGVGAIVVEDGVLTTIGQVAIFS